MLIPSLGGGGAERLVSILARCLNPSHVAPEILLLAPPDGPFASLIPSHVPVSSLRKRTRVEFPLLVWRLAKLLERDRPAVTIGFMTYANTLLLAARRVSTWKPAVIATEHNLGALEHHGPARRARNMLARGLYPDAARLVSVSSSLKQELADAHPRLHDRVLVIPNPYDPILDEPALPSSRAHPWLAEPNPVVGSFGRLSAEKGHADLLRALAILRAELPVRLIIAGDGPERGRLERLAAELGVREAVAFTGFQPNPFPLMSQVAIVAHAALSEAFGLVLVEAARAGAAIVATDCDYGPREVIEDGENGILVPPGDPQALALALKRVLSDQGLAARLRAGAQRSAATFSPTVISARYAALIREVAAERRQ